MAYGSTYTLTNSEAGSAINVRVSFTDDGGNAESLTGSATAMVEPAVLGSQTSADSAPEAPIGASGTAVFIGGVDLEWSNVPGAASYEAQQFRNGAWNDLPGDGVTIAFYGAGAIVSGLDPDSTLWFRVRAVNEHGASAWSDMIHMNATSEFLLGKRARPANEPATGALVIQGDPQVGATLWADTTGIEDGNGRDRVQFTYQWTSDDGTGDVDIAGATHLTYVVAQADEGKTLRVRVSFVDRLGYTESVTGAATDTVTDAIQQQTANTPATGAPAITGTAQVGETLTADVSGIADDDGLTNTVYSYQWLADDADIADATATTYTLVDADVGAAVKVRVSFTDDAGHEESLTSAATTTVTAADPDASRETAIDLGDITDMDRTRYPTHTINGSDDRVDYFKFTITEPKHVTSGIRQLDRDATVTLEDSDGNVIQTKAQTGAEHVMIYGTRLEGTYYIRVEATEVGANEYRLAHGVRAPDPDKVAELRGEDAPSNSAPTGAPGITGTAQVGETLTADVSGIADADGLTNAVYSYQWLADDADIAGATATTYTLVDADVGAAVKVRVSFTDDAGSDETLTSAATDVVVAPEPTEPPAKPTGLITEAHHDRVVLSWDDPQDDSITGYVILRRNRAVRNGGQFTELVSDTGSAATSYTDTDVEPGAAYTYRIRAINGHGVSERSHWTLADTPEARGTPDGPV